MVFVMVAVVWLSATASDVRRAASTCTGAFARTEVGVEVDVGEYGDYRPHHPDGPSDRPQLQQLMEKLLKVVAGAALRLY